VDSPLEFHQTFKKEQSPMICKIFHKIEGEGIPLNSFHEATITWKIKPDKDSTMKRKL
jgi:hypothetical protein